MDFLGDDGAAARAGSAHGKPFFSGVAPHLASFNEDGECGIGALAVWADRLWWITYAPHRPNGSSDKLRALDEAFDLWVGDGSVGGTAACRRIHEATGTLLLGPYAIDRSGDVRAIPPKVMPGRLTAIAPHLGAPRSRVWYATMEEGFYELDLVRGAVRTAFPDANGTADPGGTLLPGYHGKGLHAGQGVLVYANNGEPSAEALQRPDVPSGCLAEWTGDPNDPWTVVRRNQFCEVTGPCGLQTDPHADTSPIYSIGFDHRSCILMVRDAGSWHAFRFPKASHAYDGAHGWNTEWPRIRDIGEAGLLMTMHGALWRFPRTFRVGNTAGMRPRSSYLRVVADFCRFGERIVFGCDDAAKNEFLNTRRIKQRIDADGHAHRLQGTVQSQSNLWFVEPGDLDTFGPTIGQGALWIDDEIVADVPSEPYLFAGYAHRSLHLAHRSSRTVTFHIEIDSGDGRWQRMRSRQVDPFESAFESFAPSMEGAWIRIVPDQACRATAIFFYRGADDRGVEPAQRFAAFTRRDLGDGAQGEQADREVGRSPRLLVRAGSEKEGLQVLPLAPEEPEGAEADTRAWTVEPDLDVVPASSRLGGRMREHIGLSVANAVRKVGKSLLYEDDDGTRYRLPIGADPAPGRVQRTAREVVTERDLLHCGNVFYELPARGAGGFGRIRPIATHPFVIDDFCSWRGLLVLSGELSKLDDPHVVHSGDGRIALWLGAIDDLWALGKARGSGGPWTETPVEAGEASDPFLMHGFDRKRLRLEHDRTEELGIEIQVDVTGHGRWGQYRFVQVPSGRPFVHEFPRDFSAYWIRFRARAEARVTAHLEYS
ncbi:MAG: hypothetical protein KDC95_16795 [Planctomycetes bacterium]|nr:hypothetical protein [Planctomycetota bacterium]